MFEIHIDTQGKTRKIEQFWNNIHFHPTDAIEDFWGKKVLEDITKDGIGNYIRIYTMFEDIVSVDENGTLTYDYSLADERMDYLAEKNFKLLICFNFMPVCIAKDPFRRSSMPRYKNKLINYSEPKDYALWQEICADFTRHVVERYGAETVESWYFHCWNEPDHVYWLNDVDIYTYDQEKVDGYTKLYDYFAAGVTSVNDKIKIGGPSAAGNDKFLESFLAHTQNGVNHVTKKIGSRLDFISIHTYSNVDYGYQNEKAISTHNLIKRTRNLHTMFEKYGYGDIEIVIDEWGAACAGFLNMEQVPEHRLRETEYYPAFFAKLIDLYLKELESGWLNMNKMLICLSGQHDSVKNFDGYRSFFTLDHFKKPIYNGFAMAAKLGSVYIDSTISEKNQNLGVIATKDDAENYKIMIYYTDEEIDSKLNNVRVKLNLEHLTGEYRLRHYRIDHNNSNSYTKYLELGSPITMGQKEKEAVFKVGELSILYPEENIKLNGSYSEDMVMTPHSVSLIELIKTQ